jgi:acyl-CoA oxidase
MANLIINGQSHGIQWFVVQVRDCATGRLMPGIVAGNIGPKAGRNGLDNGWIQFNHVRVPRKHMLQRWASVSREGVFKPSPNPSIAYTALIPERLSVLFNTISTSGHALTIATRYSCVRRQGSNDEIVMDFQTQQVQLMPGIASLYVFSILNR